MPRKPRTADAEWKKQRNIQSEMSLLSCSFKTGSIIFHLPQFLFQGLFDHITITRKAEGLSMNHLNNEVEKGSNVWTD